MQRRTFLQTGLFGALGACSGTPTFHFQQVAAGELRLNANENPLGISPRARQALVDNLANANRYPYTLRGPLTEAIAARHGVASRQVVLGAGSTEVLQMAVQAFAGEGATFVMAEPTFEDVPHYARPFSVEIHKVPLRGDGAHDLQRMRKIVEGAAGPALVYVCNPNNPTGTLTPVSEVADWIGEAPERVSFLVDEAYFDYAQDAPGYASMVESAAARPGVVVVRTFSKLHGMAGLRLGYGLAHEETAARLLGLQCRNNANQLVQAAALASLRDEEHLRESLRVNEESRRLACGVLDELELDYLPSHTNFVMHRIRGDLDEYIERMREAGIRVGRPFPPMLDHNRVSLATPAEMERWTSALREFRGKGWV